EILKNFKNICIIDLYCDFKFIMYFLYNIDESHKVKISTNTLDLLTQINLNYLNLITLRRNIHTYINDLIINQNLNSNINLMKSSFSYLETNLLKLLDIFYIKLSYTLKIHNIEKSNFKKISNEIDEIKQFIQQLGNQSIE